MNERKYKLINGNNKPYYVGLPHIVILGYLNKEAIEHIRENTGLELKENVYKGSYQCQPKNEEQIIKLFLTYNFITTYYNNANYKNTLFLKINIKNELQGVI